MGSYIIYSDMKYSLVIGFFGELFPIYRAGDRNEVPRLHTTNRESILLLSTVLLIAVCDSAGFPASVRQTTILLTNVLYLP